mgnify:FL=1
MTDGNIQAAKSNLDQAVDRLCAPRPAIFQHRMRYAPSLYDALRQDLAGTQGDHKSHAKSQPPIWIDACQLLSEIDGQTRKWSPGHAGMGTCGRLAVIAGKSWRPQDTDHVNLITSTVLRWCDAITGMLEPQSVKTISAPCPSCGRNSVFGKDSAGDVVRRPALRIVGTQGCTCAACDAHWSPDRYLFLCKLLGFDLPEGVLE